MSSRHPHSFLLFSLALVFAAGLTFASVELPYLIDRFLINVLTTPGFDSHADERSAFMAELFIGHYHLRLVGYVCFAAVITLIVIGFMTRETGLATLGAIAVMLPVFAQFAGVMFFLAGLGILNLIWLPVLDFSLEVQRLGLIIRAPFDLVLWVFRRVGVNAFWPITCACIGSGLFIFLLGTYTWLRTKSGIDAVATSLVYRFSRHPQYLGWILWTYGLFLLLQLQRYPKRSWGIDASLSWLISTMVIIGVAMLEELSMRQRYGEVYDAYRRSTPFLLPVPKSVSRLFSLPTRIFFRKEYPSKRKEIVVILLFYSLLFIGASAFWYGPGLEKALAIFSSAGETRAQMAGLAAGIRETRNSRERYFLAKNLAKYGAPAVEFFIPMLSDDNGQVRIAASEQLRTVSSHEAIPFLIAALNDSLEDVRGNSLRALSIMNAPEAIEPMKRLLDDTVRWVRSTALQELARMHVAGVVQNAVDGLGSSDVWFRIDCINILGRIGDKQTVGALAAQLNDRNAQVRRATVVALARIASPGSREALELAMDDEDWEVRLYAGEALKILENQKER